MENILLQIVSSVAVTVITGLIAILMTYLKNKIKNELINSCLTRVESITNAAAHLIQQEFVNSMKASGGGKLTLDQIDFLKATSLEYVKSLLDSTATKLIDDIGIDLNEIINAMVQKSVHDIKTA